MNLINLHFRRRDKVQCDYICLLCPWRRSPGPAWLVVLCLRTDALKERVSLKGKSQILATHPRSSPREDLRGGREVETVAYSSAPAPRGAQERR